MEIAPTARASKFTSKTDTDRPTDNTSAIIPPSPDGAPKNGDN